MRYTRSDLSLACVLCCAVCCPGDRCPLAVQPKKKKQLNYGSQFAMPTNMRKETVFDDDEERLMDAILG